MLCFFVSIFGFPAAKSDERSNAEAPNNIQVDDALNRLIDDTTLAAMGNKSVTQNRSKTSKQRHKNGGGRSHATGKKSNGAQLQSESKSASNNQIDTAREFMATETDGGRDHIQTD